MFDGARCVEPEHYSCVAGAEGGGGGTCDQLPDGLHLQPGSHCRAYFRCSLGYKSVFICSGDSLFDGERCVPQGRCSEDATATLLSHAQLRPQPQAQVQQQPQAQAPQPRPPSPETTICTGKTHGYFADHTSSCRR